MLEQKEKLIQVIQIHIMIQFNQKQKKKKKIVIVTNIEINISKEYKSISKAATVLNLTRVTLRKYINKKYLIC